VNFAQSAVNPATSRAEFAIPTTAGRGLDERAVRGPRLDTSRLTSREVVVAITNGKLDFGPWEQIFHVEFDGDRRKRALVKGIGE